MNCPARSDSLDNRQRLIQVAAKAFVEEGYQASMDRIVERAGPARQTVYNYSPRKKDLFSAEANLAAKDILISLDSDGGDTRERILCFATAFMEQVLGDGRAV